MGFGSKPKAPAAPAPKTLVSGAEEAAKRRQLLAQTRSMQGAAASQLSPRGLTGLLSAPPRAGGSYLRQTVG